MQCLQLPNLFDSKIELMVCAETLLIQGTVAAVIPRRVVEQPTCARLVNGAACIAKTCPYLPTAPQAVASKKVKDMGLVVAVEFLGFVGSGLSRRAGKGVRDPSEEFVTRAIAKQ